LSWLPPHTTQPTPIPTPNALRQTKTKQAQARSQIEDMLSGLVKAAEHAQHEQHATRQQRLQVDELRF